MSITSALIVTSIVALFGWVVVDRIRGKGDVIGE